MFLSADRLKRHRRPDPEHGNIALGKPVRMQTAPREEWEPLFRSQGMKNPLPRIQMIDGFNEGWIEFEVPESTSKGSMSVDTVIRDLVERTF